MKCYWDFIHPKILASFLFAFGTSEFWQSIQRDPAMYVSVFKADLDMWVHTHLPTCVQTHIQSLEHALEWVVSSV